MADSLFSERHGLAPQPGPKADDDLPAWVREAIMNDVRNLTKNRNVDFYQLIRPYVWKVLKREPADNPQGGPWSYYIPRTLNQCAWWQFYDILEELAQLLIEREQDDCFDALMDKINVSLAREAVPWKMINGKIIHALHPQIQKNVTDVQNLLAAPQFNGPDRQFGKAIDCLNRRPKPDTENCVKDAVGAMEGIANILTGTKGKQLNSLLNEEPYKSGIHRAIRESIGNVYVYRGNAQGVAHSLVGKVEVGIEESIWVLAVSATTILYLVSKFPKQQ